jgi:hypothetical protein
MLIIFDIYICVILITFNYIIIHLHAEMHHNTYNVQLRNLFAHSDGQASVPHCFHGRDFRRKAWPQSSPAPCLTQCRLMCVQRLGRIGAQTAPGDFATPPSNLATSPCDANGGTVPRLWVPFSLWKRKLKK